MPFKEKNLIEVLNENNLKMQHVKVMFYNLLCSLNYLHSANIVHRDLKPQNVLVDSSCRVSLCDFGLARTLPESVVGKHNGQSHKIRNSVIEKLGDGVSEEVKQELIVRKMQKQRRLHGDKDSRPLSPHVVSRWYRPPEIILIQEKYDQAVDIWSAGCILFEMLSRTSDL